VASYTFNSGRDMRYFRGIWRGSWLQQMG
jgi:hypothetical protein